jgi:uncharacterized damage-inducible protein DinB
MLEMIRDLVAHKGWANARLLAAIGDHPGAAADREILELLHHILISNRFWLLNILGQPFDLEREQARPASLDALADGYVSTQSGEQAWIAQAAAADLERILESELIPGGRFTVSQAVVQVCMHSQGHRSQLAKMLRRYGVTPPMTDFILWLRERQVGSAAGGGE